MASDNLQTRHKIRIRLDISGPPSTTISKFIRFVGTVKNFTDYVIMATWVEFKDQIKNKDQA